MKIAILGATRGIGRALARELAGRGDQLCLLGRDAEALAKSAADLAIRSDVADEVATARCDLRDPAGFGPALDHAGAQLGGLDGVIVTAGVFDSQNTLADDTPAAIDLMTVDFTHTIAFCEEARRRLLAADGPTFLCVFGSVAGDRGRTSVAIYGAAKAGLATYLEAMDHAHRRRGLATICVKPGFVRTGMTHGLAEPPFAADPEPVARAVVRAIDRRRPVVYAPSVWRWIMCIIRALPRAVMRRISF